MSVYSEEEIEKVKGLHEFELVTGGGRRLNLYGIELIDIVGYNPDIPSNQPQVAVITCKVDIGSYGDDWKMASYATYSAPIPSEWSNDTDIQTLSDFAMKGAFDITVSDSVIVKSKGMDYEVMDAPRQNIHMVSSEAINEVVKHKLLGNLPSSKGFDDSLIDQINTIIRSRLFNKLMMQVGEHRISAAITKEMVEGVSGGVEALSNGVQDYRFLTTSNEGYHVAPFLKLKSSMVLKYEAGYMIYIDTIYHTDYPHATPVPTKPAKIKSFIDNANFDLNVIKVTLGINKDVTNGSLITKDDYLTLARAFDGDEARKLIQLALTKPNEIENKTLAKAISELFEKANKSIAYRIKNIGECRLDMQ